MFFQIIEVAKIVHPKIIFLENVANLIDHDNGKTFITMFNALSELNYVLRYRNISVHEYGNTPQTRNRTYIVAFSDELMCEKFCYPEHIKLTTNIFDVVRKDVRKKMCIITVRMINFGNIYLPKLLETTLCIEFMTLVFIWQKTIHVPR